LQTIKTAVISAAGVGSRLGLNRPKCLIEIDNITLIGNILKNCQEIPNIYIVVGFMENDVIQEVLKYRSDVIFVRNPDFAVTSNTHSIALASNHLTERILIIDGDTYFDKEAIAKILYVSTDSNQVVGITKVKTEDAVYVKLSEEGKVSGFSREPISDYEWTGIGVIDPIKLEHVEGFVYLHIEKQLPAEAVEISSWEIDTPSDLQKLRDFLNSRQNK
jgi:choline kinase